MPDTDYIYVLGRDGKPQMPTKRKRYVKKLLDAGKARIACRIPYTIQLLYRNEPVLQPLMAGIDPGRTNIGVSVINENAEPVFSAVVETRNKDIKKLMDARRTHRRASRNGERKARQRLARRFGTMLKSGMIMRKLPQYSADKFVTCRIIRNTQARFCNRVREAGWLTPSADQLVETHVNVIKKIQKFLPVTDVTLEVNRFAFALMDDSEISGIDFQNGPLKGYEDVNAAVSDQQHGKCILCGNDIEHFHHIVPRSQGGSNTLKNIAGLCECCHGKVHTDPDAKSRLEKLKNGILKKYSALSVLNQAIPYIWSRLAERVGMERLNACTGRDTSMVRQSIGYEKTKNNQMHEADAFCIACLGLGIGVVPGMTPEFTYVHKIVQFRRHDRAIINNQRERTYRLNGETVAKNRRPRFEQKDSALSDWYEEQVKHHGRKEADRMRSQLTVEKSTRRYNDQDRLMPGALFEYMGEYYVLSGQLSNGQYLRAYGDKKTNYLAKKCRIIRHNEGLVFVA